MRLLKEIARLGIYGRTTGEVAARFIDQALERFVPTPRLKVRKDPATRGPRRGRHRAERHRPDG